MNLTARATALLLALCPAAAAQAQGRPDATIAATPYVWRNVTVGGGGFAPAIIYSTAEPGLAYLRTDMGGAYRWDSAAQAWVPLEDSLPQSSDMGIESLAADPRDPNIVYLAAGMYARDPAAILRSSDRGRSWTITPVPFRMGGNEDGRGLGERLAIDPDRTSTLLFGSRHDGLQRSDDSGRSWRKVENFPWPGLGKPAPHTTHAGISFVLFDPGAKTIYAAVADPTSRHLFRSNNAGASWHAVPGGPSPDLLPVKAALDRTGHLYVTYCSGMGPNDIAAGAVWRLDTRTGAWTDVTPVRGSEAEGGYMGVSLDRQHSGIVAVSTVDRWRHKDTVWLSHDFGRSWTSLRERSELDVAATPFLKFDQPSADFGHWIAGLAFDPFDGRTLAYTTGATVMRTRDALRPRLTWTPWVRGVEQTAIVTLTSPTGGAPLISGFGDIAGFVQDRLDVSPPHMHLDPFLPNTNSLDYAGLAPAVVVRSGAPPSRGKIVLNGISLAWSADGGHSWTPLAAPPVALDRQPPARFDTDGQASINVSADGMTFVVSGPVVLATANRGASWWRSTGLPAGARAIADKAAPNLFYAIDFPSSRLFVSRDGARSFQPAAAAGLPKEFSADRPRSRETPFALQATPGRAGELWLLLGGRLYRSTDAGRTFARSSAGDLSIRLFALGKAAANAGAPALYAFGERNGLTALWRSTDGGATWARINDDAHQWGLRIRVLAGDPRIFGRVYVGTDGRGIFYGDPARPSPLR